MSATVFGLNAAAYTPHELHRSERVWLETNCYVDLWIELLHTMRLDPVACMAFTLAMDFEGDQWTFFKQPAADLYNLYGVDVQELTIWRPVIDHVAEQVKHGRVPLVEVDSFHLPDTTGVAYGIEHTKTTIGVETIDLRERRMGYFHNAGYFELSGADLEGIFRDDTASLAPYTEIAKFDRLVHRTDGELAAMARELTRYYLGRIPCINPVTKYRTCFADDMTWLAGEEMAVFYKYAFATLRQCGACAEMASTFLTWLAERGGQLTPAADEFASIASGAKAIQFKIARMMATRKPADVTLLLDQMEASWNRAISDLVTRYAA
ncbi:MAG TPA: DUF1839 family protein [Gemmatimonadaceae bacterium]|nr:DUF1839 family protein [Gemmatimonadaceae bacterium]